MLTVDIYLDIVLIFILRHLSREIGAARARDTGYMEYACTRSRGERTRKMWQESILVIPSGSLTHHFHVEFLHFLCPFFYFSNVEIVIYVALKLRDSQLKIVRNF